jgi:plastocyanin
MDIRSAHICKIICKILCFPVLSLAIIFCANCFAAKPVIVYMHDNYFDPAIITIHSGQKVIWMNKGKKDHTVTSNNGYFDSGDIHPGSSMSYIFKKPGTYRYKCSIHTFMSFGMTGQVIVKPS